MAQKVMGMKTWKRLIQPLSTVHGAEDNLKQDTVSVHWEFIEGEIVKLDIII